MTDKTQTPASNAATPATTQPTAPVETEDTPMTELSSAAPDPKVAAVETRTQPKLPKTDAPAAPDTEAVATRAREAERDRVSTIYVLTGGTPEPRRVCRRLQLLSRMEHHEQDNEQVFPRSARACRSPGSGQSRAA